MDASERKDDGLDARLRDALRRRPDVTFAYLFGSRGRGSGRPSSDVDVAVYLDEERVQGAATGESGGSGPEDAGRSRSRTDVLWGEIHAELVRACAGAVRPEREAKARSGAGGRRGRDRGGAPEGVDLVLLNRAPPLLADRVARTGRLLLSRDEPERVRWLVRAKSRYCDLRPLRERLDRRVSERIRGGRFGRRHAAGEGSGR